MTRHEREDYGEETRDLIAGLRHIAGETNVPPELLPHILAHGQQWLPSRHRRARRWWSTLASWRPHPLLWGPAIAVACFIAGVLSSPMQLDAPGGNAIPETQKITGKRPAPFASHSVAQDEAQPQPAVPSTSPSERQDAARQQPETQMPGGRTAPQARESRRKNEPRYNTPATHEEPPVAAMSRPLPASPMPPQEVTTVLPAALYERLLHEAQRRHQDLSALLREAVEAYLQGAEPGN
jgi:hypothetical protein